MSSYTASKHGVLGITRLLANEWAAKGINVNVIAPGYIETTIRKRCAMIRPQQGHSRPDSGGRWGEARDIGDAAVFLLSEASRYMHGAVLPVDGGWLAR